MESKGLSALLATLKQADKRLHANLSQLWAEADTHNASAAAVLDALARDRAVYAGLQSTGVVLRRERSLLAAIEAVQQDLQSEALLGSPSKTPHDRCGIRVRFRVRARARARATATATATATAVARARSR